jgi:hypothetical protein
MRDLFISYTHTDNLTFSESQRGWVANFHKAVEVRLTQLLGRPSDVFYDDAAMARTSALTPTIKKEVRASKILVSILSPGYIASDWCNTELELFADASSERGGLFVDTQSRVVKAIKLPVDRDLQKRTKVDLSDVLGYEFYRYDPASGPLEFDPDADAASRLEFTKRVSTLAYDICNILKKLGDEGEARDSVASQSGKVVYVAETTADLADESARLRRTLQQYGHTVLPSAPYPYGRSYAERAAADLARADAAVHLIGSSYGPEREQRSVLELQYELAGDEMRRRPELKRLVWSPPEIVPDEERQAAFLARLNDEATLIVTPFEKLKDAVQATLQPPAAQSGARDQRRAAEAERLATKIYLIFDASDAANVKELDDWLYEHDYDVMHPIFAGNESDIRQHDERCLVDCDAALLYSGFAPSYWLPQRVMDLQKAFAYGRGAPFMARGVVIGRGPDEDRTDKDLFRNKSVIKMEMYGGFDAHALTPFLQALVRAQDTAV